jgi:hypothetical protein
VITAKQCQDRYGSAKKEIAMVLFDVPADLEIGVIPKRIYCNRDLVDPLKKAFKALIETGAVKELRDYAGCFNIRMKTGGKTLSTHAWGLAVDLNPSDNQYGKKPHFSEKFVQCFESNGFVWGGRWKIPDGMHYELKEFPK